MAINEQQQITINKYIEEPNYTGIVEIITNIFDQNDEKHLHTLNIILKMAGRDNMLNVYNLVKLADVYDNYVAAPAIALESAYENFYEQLNASSFSQNIATPNQELVNNSSEPSTIKITSGEEKKLRDFEKSIENLPHTEQVKKITENFTPAEIIKTIKILRERLAPGIKSHNIDQKLSDTLILFKEAASFHEDNNTKEYSVWTSNDVSSLEDIEKRKLVRIVKGMGILEELYKMYQQEATSGENDGNSN